MIKLKPGEAEHLADLLQNVARTSDPKEQAEVLAWIKRLRGGR